MNILIIEDEPSLVQNLFDYFEARDYCLDAAPDGLIGLHFALTRPFDAIILDWMLPRLQGPDVLRKLRAAGSTVPVVLLTARDELGCKVEGFRAGADDYLTKPFDLPELEVRLEALVRRVRGDLGGSTVLRVGELELNLGTLEAQRGGKPIHLFPTNRRMLEVLMRAFPDVVEKSKLEEAIWGDALPDADLLRSHVYELRRALDGDHEHKLLRTVPRVGYRLAIEGG